MHLQKAVKVTKKAVVFLFVTMFIWIGHTDNLTAQSLVTAGGVGTWTATMTAKGPNSVVE